MNTQTSSPQPPLSMPADHLGHRFNNQGLLTRALTHSTFRVEHPGQGRQDNETLEFLGDAVLDLVIGALLIDRYPTLAEGDLTKLRSALVQEQHLARVATDLCLGDFLLLGKGEDRSGGRHKPSLLASTYEAVIGAIFLDSDYPTVQALVEGHFNAYLAEARGSLETKDAKSALQELTQEQFNTAPAYVLDSEEGPDHAKTFTVSALLLGQVIGSAAARSKKAAEQKAAAAGLDHLRQRALSLAPP